MASAHRAGRYSRQNLSLASLAADDDLAPLMPSACDARFEWYTAFEAQLLKETNNLARKCRAQPCSVEMTPSESLAHLVSR